MRRLRLRRWRKLSDDLDPAKRYRDSAEPSCSSTPPLPFETPVIPGLDPGPAITAGRASHQSTSTHPLERRIQSAGFPVFAFSVDLGTITKTSAPVVWALGHDQDPAVQVSLGSTNSGTERLYWKRGPQVNEAIPKAVSPGV